MQGEDINNNNIASEAPRVIGDSDIKYSNVNNTREDCCMFHSTGGDLLLSCGGDNGKKYHRDVLKSHIEHVLLNEQYTGEHIAWLISLVDGVLDKSCEK